MTETRPISLEGVSYFFGRGSLRKQILHEVSLSVAPGEIVILTGPSGSGKTTLLTLMGALRAASDGSLQIFGKELRGASERQRRWTRRQIGFIFQSHNLLRSLTVDQNVAMSQRLVKGGGKKRREQRLATLERVGLAEHVDKHPSALSGGQKQRAGIARALVNHPKIVLADEPTASLDKKSGRDVVDLIEDLARADGAAVVLVTHDTRIFDVADRILHLEDGRMRGSAEAVAEDTSRLLSLLGKQDPDSSNSLAAFAFALARVAWADDKVLDAERAAVREVLRDTVGLAPGEVELVMELSLLRRDAPDWMNSTHVSSDGTMERNRRFIESLYKIARSDDQLVEAELREIEAIAAEFGIDESMLTSARLGDQL